MAALGLKTAEHARAAIGRLGQAFALALLTALPAAAQDSTAPDTTTAAAPAAKTGGDSSPDVTVTYGYNFFGDLKYPKNFKHLDYVNPDAPKGGELSIWAPGTFDSFNPYTRKGLSGALASTFYDSLLTSTSDEIGTQYCYICTTMEYPKDLSWVVYNLRDDAKFWDGSGITADDVKFTYDLFLKEGLPSYRAILGSIVDKVEVLGPYKLKVTFKDSAPLRDRIGNVGGLPIFSKAWFEKNKYSLDESRLVMNMGSGPYKLSSYEVNQRIIYKRDPNYWGWKDHFNVGRWNYDKIRVEYFGDSSAALEGFKGGAYSFRIENSSKDWATSYDFPAVKDGTVIKTELPDGSIASGQAYSINMRRPQFQDIRVREALGLMFNFEWSNKTLFYGLYTRIKSFWDNSNLAATGKPGPDEIALLKPLVDQGLLDASILTDDAVVPPVSSADRQLDRKNLRKAGKLLDAAGWTVGDDGMRRKDGQTLRVQILSTSPAFDRVHNPYVSNLRALGVDASLERIDPAQYTERTRSFDFDMITDSFGMGYEPGADLVQTFGSADKNDSVFNSMGLKNKAVDKLIDVVRKASTHAELTTSVHALDRVLRSIRFWVPQWYKNAYTVAYYNEYQHPKTLPPYSLGYVDIWWVDQAKEKALKDAGKI